MIHPEEFKGVQPLSPIESSMLQEVSASTTSTAYTAQMYVTIEGHVDLQLLKDSWQELIDETPALRTSFHLEGAMDPIKFIHDSVEFSLEKVEYDASASDQLTALLCSQRQNNIDVAEAPLMRGALLATSSTSSVFVWTYHQLMLDNQGALKVLECLFHLYMAKANGEAFDFPILSSTASEGSRDDLATQLSYWKNKLSDAAFVLDMPMAKLRPVKRTENGATLRFEIAPELAKSLSNESSKHGFTKHEALLATFAVLLSKISRQEDILIGGKLNHCGEATQHLAATSNTSVFRIQLDQEDGLHSIVKKVSNAVAGAQANRDIPFQEIVNAIEPEVDPSYSPIFQASFDCTTAGFDTIEKDGWKISGTSVASVNAKCDLAFAFDLSTTEWFCTITYGSDLYDASTIEAMAGHYISLLEKLLGQPEQSIKEMSMLGAAEYHQIVHQWNATAQPVPENKTVLDFVAEIAAEYPERAVFEYDGEAISYAQLETESNNFACNLLSQGIQKGDRIALLANKSIRLASAIIGIMKSGGVYVPVDPDYPQERIDYMLENSRARLLLCDKELTGNYDLPILNYADPAVFGESDFMNPRTLEHVAPDQVAYIIYTSGSTGRPKGVMIRHIGLLNLTLELKRSFGVDEHCKTLQFASLSFDTSIAEVFTSLIGGGTLVMAPKAKMMPGPDLIHLLQSAAITHITIQPSILQSLPPAELPLLSPLVVAGEACPLELVKKWGEGRVLFNAYGPTETSVCASMAICTPNDEQVTIGRPIGNFLLYVLDENQQPLPAGIPGELYIGGIGVAAGYVNLPEQTAERFICNPFSEEPDARMYRTGDLVKYLPNGNIDYLGRIDRQVKLRGFRIEPDEVEHRILEIDGVEDVAVLARFINSNNASLVAFYTTEQNATLPAEAIRQQLEKKIPSYLIPSLIQHLDKMPLTPHNKVDYLYLTSMELSTDDSGEVVAPQSEVETILLHIFKEVLGREKVSVEDNFFAIGGDSIIGIQIVSRANAEGIMITLKQLFQERSIAGLATVAEISTPVVHEQGAVLGDIITTPVHTWFFTQEYNNISHYNQSLLLDVSSGFNVSWAEAALQSIVEHHDVLRMRVRKNGTVFEEFIPQDENGATFSSVDFTTVDASERSTQLLKDMNQVQASLNVFDGPMFSVRHYELGTESLLLFVAHHLLVDGVSWRILAEDFLKAYKQTSLGETIVLPPKTTSFKEWAESAMDHSASYELGDQVAYWADELQEGVQPLPTDHDAQVAANTIVKAATHSESLDVATTEMLISKAHDAYNTHVNDLLLSALAMSFENQFGLSKVLIAMEGHGREDVFGTFDLARTVGWFTSVYPVAIKVNRVDGLRSLITTIKEQLRAIPDHGVGFGLLKHGLAEDYLKDVINSLPQPELIFNYLGQSDLALPMDSDWKISTRPTGAEQATDEQRSCLIEVNAIVSNGTLNMDWTYCPEIHKASTIEGLANGFSSALKELTTHCLDVNEGGFTPSDFPEANIEQDQLDALLSQIRF